MAGIIAKKLEMTRVIKGDKFVPVTLLQIPELMVVGMKTIERDGYSALIVGVLGKEKELQIKEGNKTLNKSKFEQIEEFEINEGEGQFNVGDKITIDVLDGIEKVEIEGISKGKGFAGAMKRWNFSGGPGRVGSKFHRALGSIGNRKPRRTHKGKKMHGHMGCEKINLKKVPLELVNKEISVIGVRGGVPGGRNSFVNISF
ncbi:50S ribosomal protein L3 [Candidatus Gracilibacteria bacterium]|nr:50S ribosomal protein L3 [Candidatus Gracilibacteria bacterium]NUJ98631.1 50S ribosomal protein L3 [Candidatus Gracilibacteria bacterium]